MTFPLDFISNFDGDLVSSEADGRLCLIAYSSAEMAELYLASAGDPALTSRIVQDAKSARQLARSTISHGVTTLLWNSVFEPTWFPLIDLTPLL